MNDFNFELTNKDINWINIRKFTSL